MSRFKSFNQFILFFSLIIAMNMASAVTHTQLISGQWVDSHLLKAGMKLITKDNTVLTVEQAWKRRQYKATTYNLEVQNNHTYFISQEFLFVHNMCDEVIDMQAFRKKMTAQKLAQEKTKRDANVQAGLKDINQSIFVESEPIVSKAGKKIGSMQTSVGPDGVIMDVDINSSRNLFASSSAVDEIVKTAKELGYDGVHIFILETNSAHQPVATAMAKKHGGFLSPGEPGEWVLFLNF